MLVSTTLAVLLTVLVTLYILIKRQFSFWKKLGCPQTNPVIPWGDAQGVNNTRSLGQVINDVYLKFPNERFVGFYFLFQPQLLIRDPDLIKSIAVTDFSSFHSRGLYYNEKDDPLSVHLFTLEGTRWLNMRKTVSGSFTSGKIKSMMPILIGCSEQLYQVIDEPASRSEVIDVKDFTARFTTDIICQIAYGINADTLHKPDSEIRHYGKVLFNPSLFQILNGLLQILLPDLARKCSSRTLTKDLSDFFKGLFEDSIKYREENNYRRNDFLDSLMHLKNGRNFDGSEGSGSTKLTMDEAAAEAFMFFLAGFETSSSTIQFALYELAKNPEMQEKAREETIRILDKYNGKITYEAIAELDYLKKVLDETLRFYPLAPFIQRMCNQDYTIPGSNLVIPKGTYVVIDCQGLHHDEQYFPNPEKFDPERFTEEAKLSRHSCAYLPFGLGPRTCIGTRFGQVQTRVGVMTLLKNFRFAIAKETPIPLKFSARSFILQPSGPMYLRITKI